MKLQTTNIFLALVMISSFFATEGLYAQATEPEKLIMQTAENHQTMVGFGAALAYYESWLNAHPYKSEIYQAIFGELSLDVLRVRNAYDYDPVMIDRVKEYMNAAQNALGHPIKLLSTSWGPPGYLKNTGDRKNGGTLRYNVGPGGVEFDYAGFAHWWKGSLQEYENHGILPDYISMQNEPGWTATWETCILKPTETVNATDTIAGYNKALDAVYDSLETLARRPLILGPETAAIGSNVVQSYVNALDVSKLDGIAHHLYGGANPENPYASSNFASVGNLYPSLPHFQTEYSGSDWFSLAGLIYKSLFDEKAVAYLYWDLIWPQKGLVSVDNPWNSLDWIYPNGYTKTKEFYVFKQFSAFIHPGWQMIGHTLSGSNSASLAFKSPTGDSAVCVLINRSTSENLTVHVEIPGYRAYESAVYTTSVNEDCLLKGALIDSTLTVAPRSITTVDMRLTAYDPGDDIDAPSVPIGLSVTDSTGISISIVWDQSTDNIGVSGYKVFVDGSLDGTSVNTSYTISGLASNSTYEISVSAFDNVPNESAQSASITGTTMGPDTEPPTTPANLVEASKTTSSISLSWDVSIDNVGVTGYHVFANGLLKGTAFTNSFTIAPLTQGTEYLISVSAFDESSNESEKSSSLSVTTEALPDEQAPTIPVNLRITETTQTSISITWFPSTDNVGVTGYRIYVDGLLIGSSSTNIFTATALMPNHTYELSVSAFDAASNEGGQSIAVSGKTRQAADDEAPLLQATDSIFGEGIIEVTSSEDGSVYLVPAETVSELTAIQESSIVTMVVSAEVTSSLPASGLENGDCWLYAIDQAGNISEPQVVTVLGVGIRAYEIGKMTVYPNPYSIATTFRITLIETQQMWLSIIDSQGRIVGRESMGTLDSGDHELILERDGLPQGIYFFKLENASGRGWSGKLVIIE